jgi:hypothetical protein
MYPKKIVVGVALWYVLMLLVVIQPIPQYRPAVKNPVQVKLERYIKDPYIAEVISRTKRPYIMAAIKIVETEQAGPLIKGDNGDSHGIFQVQPRHHGKVPKTIEGQTKMAERIVEALIQKKGLKEGIRAYNGNGPAARRYSQRVIELATKIERG